MPTRQGDLFTYNPANPSQSDYDVPPNRYPAMNGTPGSNSSSREDLLSPSASSFEQSFYDTPPSNRSFRSPELSTYDTPPSNLGLEQFDTQGNSVRTSLLSRYSDETMSMSSGVSCNKSNPSVCDSARSSMDISPADLYDVPPSQREREAKAYPIRSSKDSGLDMYDSPPKSKTPPSVLEDYDVPRQAAINSEREKHFKNIQIPHSEPTSPGDFHEDYDVPPSRSPFAQSVPSQNDSVKADISQSDLEEYDVPKPVTGKPPIGGRPKARQKSNSVGSLLDDYDTPSDLPVKSSKDDMCTSKAGKSYDPEISDDENNYDEPDAANCETDCDLGAKPKTKTQENALDDLYDSPRNNAPVKNMTKEFSALSVQKTQPTGVYDVPPRVTRDSVISSRSDSSDGNDTGSNRLSTCSTDSRGSDFLIYDELPLDLDAANDLIIKLQQDLQKAINDFCKLTHSSWRKRDNFQQKQYEIKVSCMTLEQALNEFVGFGQGTLANSAKLSDRKLINKLSKYLIPLVQAHQQMKVCIEHLDRVNWQASKSVVTESPKKDDLGTIANITKDLAGDVKKLAIFIQGNSSLLFKRAKDFNRSSRSMEHSTPSPVGKPPAGRKPAIPAKITPVQARPLPAPPPTERPLPPTPTEKKSEAFGLNGPETTSHSQPGSRRNSGEYKHWSGDVLVRRLSLDKNAETDTSMFKAVDLLQEYDYVELEDDEKKQKETEHLSLDKQLTRIVENDKAELEHHVNDAYEKEMEKTLDEIDGVNIYSDDSSGTLKRGMQLQDVAEDDSGTLKRKAEDEVISDVAEYDSDTLKRETKSSESSEEVKTPVQMEQERIEIPEHDNEPAKVAPLDFEDKQVLSFYSEQLDTHMTLLSNSIEAFLQCIENSEGPKVFISHSKFVVVSAHKLVYIGDSLHKNVKHDEVRGHIIQKANCLCDLLKHTVTSTKTAALQYPSVPAVQDMVDKVTAVSHSARDLKEFVSRVSKV